MVCNGAGLFCDEGLPPDRAAASEMSGESQRARENSAYVRRLLGQRQPEFAAALAFAGQYFSCLSGRERRPGPA